MNAKIKNENVIDFEIEKVRYRLGNSDRYVEIDTGDVNFPTRFKEASDNITKYFEKLKKEYSVEDIDDIDNLKSMDIEQEIELLKKCDEHIREQMNYIFDYDVSSQAFGKASTMSVTKKGEYYFENFLNAVMTIIEKEYEVRMNKLSIRTKKYIDNRGKYTK